MANVLKRYAAGSLLAGAIVIGTAESAAAETIYAVTTQNILIFFDSATPGTVNTVDPVTGLTAGQSLIGIDFRPNNGNLYALGANFATGTASLYALNQITAAATLVAPLFADAVDATNPYTTLSGTQFGMDFNPVADRLRITSNTGQNLRVNPSNGLVITDDPLAYGGADPNTGDSPVVVAVAYSNNFAGAASTTLTGVDIGQDTDVLVNHSPPNNGTLVTLLNLPFNAFLASYDISGPTGTSYFAVTDARGGSQLYAGTTLVGPIAAAGVIAIAAPTGTAQVPEPATMALVGCGVGGWVAARRRQRRERH